MNTKNTLKIEFVLGLGAISMREGNIMRIDYQQWRKLSDEQKDHVLQHELAWASLLEVKKIDIPVNDDGEVDWTPDPGIGTKGKTAYELINEHGEATEPRSYYITGYQKGQHVYWNNGVWTPHQHERQMMTSLEAHQQETEALGDNMRKGPYHPDHVGRIAVRSVTAEEMVSQVGAQWDRNAMAKELAEATAKIVELIRERDQWAQIANERATEHAQIVRDLEKQLRDRDIQVSDLNVRVGQLESDLMEYNELKEEVQGLHDDKARLEKEVEDLQEMEDKVEEIRRTANRTIKVLREAMDELEDF